MSRSVSKRAVVAIVAGGLALAPAAGASFLGVIQTICDTEFPSCTSGIDGLTGVKSPDVSPDGKHLYACSSLDDAVIVFSRNLTTGVLTHVQTIFEGDGGIDGLDSCRGLAVSPDGKHVYTAALLDNTLGAWSRNSTTGILTLIEFERDGIGGVDGLAGANTVAVSPDGSHVYVGGRSDDAVAVFSRNSTTGAVTFIQAVFDGSGGIDGLDAVEAIRLSPVDGAHLYAAGENDDAVAVFSRDTNSGSMTFGQLTFVEVKKDGVGGVDGLNGANGVALDPLGQNVYVGSERTSGGGDWIAVFSRNTSSISPDFGKLTFLQVIKEEDLAPYTGCSGVGPENSGVSVSPNGFFVFVSNPFRGTVAAFMRSGTGTLTFIDSICDLNFGLDGLVGVMALHSTADGKHTYWAASSSEHIGVLDTKCEVPNVDLDLSAQSVSTTKTEQACRSITASDYTVLAAGNVTFEAPLIVLGDLFEVEGEFKAVQTVP